MGKWHRETYPRPQGVFGRARTRNKTFCSVALSKFPQCQMSLFRIFPKGTWTLRNNCDNNTAKYLHNVCYANAKYINSALATTWEVSPIIISILELRELKPALSNLPKVTEREGVARIWASLKLESVLLTTWQCTQGLSTSYLFMPRVTWAKDDNSRDESLKIPSFQTYRVWSKCLILYKQEEYCSISLWKEQGRVKRSNKMEIFLLNSQTSLEGSRNLCLPVVPTKIFSSVFCLVAKELGLQGTEANCTTFKWQEFILRI